MESVTWRRAAPGLLPVASRISLRPPREDFVTSEDWVLPFSGYSCRWKISSNFCSVCLDTWRRKKIRSNVWFPNSDTLASDQMERQQIGSLVRIHLLMRRSQRFVASDTLQDRDTRDLFVFSLDSLVDNQFIRTLRYHYLVLLLVQFANKMFREVVSSNPYN